ncbi:unnamed protein product [Didymodactylos carnosus]|uniref:Complex 1 LYR protein domain-containing protein n=1 Tax=Didymodactylos carnosus TaxID=1234261 RepID=A0A814ERL4_9BILA|nr:unnamed protein product [Didymodactylos carnosus]CAF0973091.1 unnamed protein product [Didymodactylos carnosus]CAF3657950.1 unnamed protein product [Didymodactylos carnosus]CAF3746008.1 unnamed protein product [Didymodactylos carnosus]
MQAADFFIMSSNRLSPVLIIYKQLIRESQKFTLYSYREYFIRRIRDEFRRNQDLKDRSKIDLLLKKAHSNLEIIRRQVIVGNLYKPQLSVMEFQSDRK